MIERLLKYYEECHSVKLSLQLNIEHDNCCGWHIFIMHGDSDTIIFDEDACSINLLCARAYIALENWARNFSELEDIEDNL